MSRYRMFLDDTGCVRNIASNHPQQRYGGVVGVILHLDYLATSFSPSFDQLRERHFGRHPDGQLPTLHLRKMKQPSPRSLFGCLNNPSVRHAFEADCLNLYREGSYTVIAVGVDKIGFYARHPSWQGSIYELLVGSAIERFAVFLKDRGVGDVVAEATNSRLDEELRTLYARTYAEGTIHCDAPLLQGLLTSRQIKIKPKSPDNIGLQMADLLASTCFSHLRRLYAEGPEFDPFAMQVADLIEREKYFRDAESGNPHGYGRIWHPESREDPARR